MYRSVPQGNSRRRTDTEANWKIGYWLLCWCWLRRFTASWRQEWSYMRHEQNWICHLYLRCSHCPVIWSSKLQTDIATSTMEARYNGLSLSMRELLPFKRLFLAVANRIGLVDDVLTTFKTTVWEETMEHWLLQRWSQVEWLLVPNIMLWSTTGSIHIWSQIKCKSTR